MREIKFRAIREYDKKWIYGSLVTLDNGNKAILTNNEVYRDGHHINLDMDDMPTWFCENTIGQYTGLKDKNGKEIYEGDIVKGHIYEKGKGYRYIGYVAFLSPSFKSIGVKQYKGLHYDINSNLEVIGNIYENPELLESE